MSQKYRDRKEAKQQKRLDKIEAKNAKRKEQRDHKGWTKVTCAAICGCCEAVLYFETRERAEAACRAAHLKHADITDDDGNTEKVDGFHGFNFEDLT